MRLQFKIGNRLFAVEVEQTDNYEELINEGYEALAEQIAANNETIENIFFEQLEVVCSECGVSLTNGEDPEDTKCLQCQANN